jgi:hypothetical protein
MSYISLHIGSDAGKVGFLGRFAFPRLRIGVWIARRAVKSTFPLLDRLILNLAGYLEYALFFSPEHAQSELEELKDVLLKLQRSAKRQIAMGDEYSSNLEELKPYRAKYQEIHALIDKVMARLRIVSQLNLTAEEVLALPENLRNEITSLSVLRFNELMKQNPDDAEEIYDEMDHWLNAELSPVLNGND